MLYFLTFRFFVRLELRVFYVEYLLIDILCIKLQVLPYFCSRLKVIASNFFKYNFYRSSLL